MKRNSSSSAFPDEAVPAVREKAVKEHKGRKRL